MEIFQKMRLKIGQRAFEIDGKMESLKDGQMEG